MVAIGQAVVYVSSHRTRHPWCMAAVRGAAAKMASLEARLLQAKVIQRF